MFFYGRPNIIPDRIRLYDDAGIRVGYDIPDGLFLIFHVQGNQLQDSVEHFRRAGAFRLDTDSIRGFGIGRIEMVGNDDQISVPGVRQGFEQIRTDNVRRTASCQPAVFSARSFSDISGA